MHEKMMARFMATICYGNNHKSGKSKLMSRNDETISALMTMKTTTTSTKMIDDADQNDDDYDVNFATKHNTDLQDL